MNNSRLRLWFYDVLILLILVMAAYFRFIGLNWDQNQHLHPDERFMTMVESALEPVNSLAEYFNSDSSTLNPHNQGYSFYVYGDLPITIVRYAAEWMSALSSWAAQNVLTYGSNGLFSPLLANLSQTTSWAGYDDVALVGRVLSALADLGSIVLLYLISARLYGRKVASLAAAFSALAVMQIQQSHFFTVDMFANFFMILATYFAVEVQGAEGQRDRGAEDFGSVDIKNQVIKFISATFFNPLILNVIGFGLALGAAVASKINAAPLAVLLPVALFVRYFRQHVDRLDQPSAVRAEEPQTAKPKSQLSIETLLVLLVLGAMVSALAFRFFMPYAFSGPGFFGVSLNPKWVANISDLRAQTSGNVDFPPALQWARRPIWFSGYNLLAWGLGWPLGILAMLGMSYMGWRIIKGEWKEHILLWGWTIGYFCWQSTLWNSTMRYQLPIYPLLALLAAWFIFNGPRSLRPLRQETEDGENPGVRSGIADHPSFAARFAYFSLAVLVLAATFAWAYAFTRIYTREHSRVQATRWIYQNIPGPYNLKIQQADGTTYTQPMSLPQKFVLNKAAPYNVQFTAFASGDLTEVLIANAVNIGTPGAQNLSIAVANSQSTPADQALANASLIADFSPGSVVSRGGAYMLKFDKPVHLEKDHTYSLRFATTGWLSLVGSVPVHETSWDDPLPLRMDGYDAYGGMYQGNLNFEMYWDDSADKLKRFETNLEAADYVFITSNRQWATTTRIPERYPLTIAYYRNLIGCPDEKDVTWCYNVAAPGMFKGKLGFELIQTFTSYPELFGYQVNTQFAEEAFTVYDAPKVLLFKKTEAYNAQIVKSLLAAVDLTHVVHVTPQQAGRYPGGLGSNAGPGGLMLPADRLAADRAGGTWSELFSYQSLQNKYPVIGLVIWYLAIALLGFFTWPLLRFLLPGLSDNGYPLAKLSGLLLLAYLVWLTASLGGQYSRLTIAVVYGLILSTGALAFFVQRNTIRQDLRTKGKYYLLIEVLFLTFFLIDLAIRLGNPDLWHPARGGERPMDFSYLNAVIKSTTFPPYDPWYAGGYINYYYWGFVLVGTPIKLLGIVPSIAYNFVLPTLFAMLGLGGFSVAWNLVAGLGSRKVERKTSEDISPFFRQLIAGLAAGAGLVLMGNLGTIQLIYRALQKMAVTNEMVGAQNVWIIQRWAWAAQGLGKIISGASLPIGWGEYYWAPSRVMPLGDLAITEFPLFTFLYSDLHAHMIALPLTLLVIAWTLSTLQARNLSRWSWLATLAFGGLAIGVLRPTNTWDFPTYLVFGVIVTGYAIFRYADLSPALNEEGRAGVVCASTRLGLHPLILRVFLAVLGMSLLAGFALLFFQPFAQWYGLAYTQVSLWTNEKTPIWSYWTHWGVFLFVIVEWMLWETRQWLAQTPVSSLAKLKPYELIIELGLAVFVGLLLSLQFILDVPVAWFAFPLAVWALVLMLRPGQPDTKRLVLFMIGTGLVLTLIVEFIVLSGDIGRMNTVFKFYLQVWVLFAISAAAALSWILNEFDEWGQVGRIIFQVFGVLLFAGGLLFTFTASMDKIRDRISVNTPFTFDSMSYMQYSTYWDQEKLDLSKDFRAIRWMQDNVKGSPVIVEGNTPEYRWGTRYTIYTGLPGVVGWNWHQRQQRALFPAEWVSSRIQEVTNFYNTRDVLAARAFLTKYAVHYIVVGQMEHSMYNSEGLAKFEIGNGNLWKAVYQDSDTVIYEVLP